MVKSTITWHKSYHRHREWPKRVQDVFRRGLKNHLSASTTVADNMIVGHAIDKKLLSTINKIPVDKLSIRSFCYWPTVDKTSFLSTNY
jgi:hypothetical protein